ncbi:hypothetical protein [Paracoccus beibuensis]|uniref:hypothetical protein n=1 Tax=Paracoccus beibuensis TaxID=547602 RepID=UPI00224056EB|nr:hypothetical protein [Paracoccus beibuensis]
MKVAPMWVQAAVISPAQASSRVCGVDRSLRMLRKTGIGCRPPIRVPFMPKQSHIPLPIAGRTLDRLQAPSFGWRAWYNCQGGVKAPQLVDLVPFRTVHLSARTEKVRFDPEGQAGTLRPGGSARSLPCRPRHPAPIDADEMTFRQVDREARIAARGPSASLLASISTTGGIGFR